MSEFEAGFPRILFAAGKPTRYSNIMTEAENPKRKSFLFVNPLQRLLPRVATVQRWSVLTGLLLSSAAAEAKIIYVNQALAAPGDGTTWSSAFKDLQAALKASVFGDSLYVAKGTYYPDAIGNAVAQTGGDRELSFVLNGVKVYGGFAGGEARPEDRIFPVTGTTLSGAIWTVDPANLLTQGQERYWSLHVVTLAASSTLDGVVIEKGRANGDEKPANQGAGILVPSGLTVTLDNCIIQDNQACESGGGVSGNIVATKTKFLGNFINNMFLYTKDKPDPGYVFSPAGQGGAISGDVTATDCDFVGNYIDTESTGSVYSASATGGAIAGTTVNLLRCLFEQNTAECNADWIGSSHISDGTSRGGAVSATTLIKAISCRFIGNRAVAAAEADISGGPIFKDDPSKGYTATTIVNGGAVNGPLEAVNCVFSANEAFGLTYLGDNTINDVLGGAISTDGNSQITNCVLVGNKVLRDSNIFTNPSQPSRGSIIGGGGLYVASGVTIAMNSTFLDNNASEIRTSKALPRVRLPRPAPEDLYGSAITTSANLKILSNIIWHQPKSPTEGYTGLIRVNNNVGSTAKISNRLYATPSTETINILTGSGLGVILGGTADFGDPYARTLPGANPLFANIANPIGPDNIWGTADDGLRILTGSPAIDKGNGLFIPKDPYDLDNDKNVTENIPVDFAGFRRIQNGKLDLGAYEFGNTSNAPDISIEQPLATVLVDGTATINFGSSRGTTKRFFLKNTGAGDLFDILITSDGPNANQFTFTQPTANDIAGGGSATFDVTFNPTISGPVTATLRIASNDPDENPFDIKLVGNSLVPDIAVENPIATDLVDASSVIDYQIVGAQSSAVKTFTVRNKGLANLNIASITSSGANAANFVVTGPLVSVVAPGASTTFALTFTPGGPGPRSADINIVSDDPDAESSFLIKVKGSGSTSPEIAVSQPFASDFLDGGTISFGKVKKGLFLSKKFVIRNIGTAPLTNLAISVAGSKMFKVTKLTATTLAPGATTEFKITFKPSSLGLKAAKILITSNDLDESQFDMNLTGTGVTTIKKKKSLNLAETQQRFAAVSSATGARSVVSTASGADGLKYLVLTVAKPTGDVLKATSAEVSSNLLDWYSGTDYTTVLVDSSTLLQVRDNTPVKEGEKRYIRLR